MSRRPHRSKRLQANLDPASWVSLGFCFPLGNKVKGTKSDIIYRCLGKNKLHLEFSRGSLYTIQGKEGQRSVNGCSSFNWPSDIRRCTVQ